MMVACPRCGAANPDAARFCRKCGLRLDRGPHGLLGAGRVAHPEPREIPAGYVRVGGAADLHYRWEPLGGGRKLLGTEPLALHVFNAGYGLAEALLRVRGRTVAGDVIFAVKRELENLATGEDRAVEIASYEIPEPIDSLDVELIDAVFAPPSDESHGGRPEGS